VILQKKTFKDLQFLNQSEAMAAILDVGQGSQKSTLSFILITQIVLLGSFLHYS
jgi:hypothetical protein